jgi:hypothetical protein
LVKCSEHVKAPRYSSMSLMLGQYYCHCDFYFIHWWGTVNKNIYYLSLLVWQQPHFTYKQSSGQYYQMYIRYCFNTIGTTSFLLLFLNWPINWAVPPRNGNVFYTIWRLTLPNKNVQLIDPRPLPKEWPIFLHTLVLARLYL